MNPLQSTFTQPGMLSQQPTAQPGLTTMSQPASQSYVSSTRQWTSSPATATSTSSIPASFSQPNAPYKFSDYYAQFLTSSGIPSTSAATQPRTPATTSFAAQPSPSFTSLGAQPSTSASFSQPTASSFSQQASSVASSGFSAQPTSTLASSSTTSMAPSQLAQTGKAPSTPSLMSQQQQQPAMLPRTSSQYTESGRVAPLQQQQGFPLQQQQQQQQQYYIPGQATQPQGVLSAQPSAFHYAPTTVELRQKPAVVQEVIRPGVREEIQPVIHRERQQTEIREEVQPVYETSFRPVQYEEKTLTPEFRTETTGNMTPVIAPGPVGSTFVQPEHKEMLVRPPVVEETIHKKIVEEIQPVVQRETFAPKLIQETQPIYEKVIESPVVNYTVLPARYGPNTFSPGFRGFQGNQFMGAGDMQKFEEERFFRANMPPGFVQRY